MDKYIGIDLGGSKIRLNDVDINGKFGKERQAIIINPLVNNVGLTEMIIGNLEQVIKRVQGEGDKVVGIGLGSPGPLDHRRGIIETPPNLKKVKNLPIVKIIGEFFHDYPAFLVHDADAALLGEQWLGAARDYRHVAMVTFGTGIGFAAIDDGHLIRGRGRASEMGHVLIDSGSRRQCSCGRQNCWESFVGTDGLAETYLEIFKPKIELTNEEKYNLSFEFRDWLSKQNDSPWKTVLNRYCDQVVLGLRNIVCTFDPECIILGGGILTGNEILLEAIKKRWQDYMFGKVKDNIAVMAKGTEIRMAELTNAGVIGAAKYAMNELGKELH